MKRYVKSNNYESREQLMNSIAYLYHEYGYDEFNKILKDNGASEDDSGPDGFMSGMTRKQLVDARRAMRRLIAYKEAEDNY